MKEIDKIQDAMWLQAFSQVRDKANPIIHKISEAEANRSWEDRLSSFQEGLEKLPAILKSMKQTPKPKTKKLRRFKMLEEHGLDAYIKACECGIKLLKEPSPTGMASRIRYAAMMFQISQATSYFDLANENIASFSEE